MAERGDFGHEMKGAVRGFAQSIRDSFRGPRTFDTIEEWKAQEEERDRKLRENDFPTNAEACMAYFPLTRKEWQRQAELLDNMDALYEEMEKSVITPEGIDFNGQRKQELEAQIAQTEEQIRDIARNNLFLKWIPEGDPFKGVPGLDPTAPIPGALPHQRAIALRRKLWEDDELPGEDI